ncbi:MAG: hypothetical protein GF331_21690 [Chitinivibrionales bacterium]|nr:hypothetical protein [Chitinivibrionales bacterium]
MNRNRALLSAMSIILCGILSACTAFTVSVDKSVRYQTIEGIGASVTCGFSIRPWRVKQGPGAGELRRIPSRAAA